MPVLTKINTNSIAEDAITGDKFAGDAYLSNTANQNISGTYSENRLYTSDAYTLSGNATVNSNIVLSSVKPTGDVVLTAGGAYTITGTGVLSAGSLMTSEPNPTNTLTGMTGVLDKTVTQASGGMLHGNEKVRSSLTNPDDNITVTGSGTTDEAAIFTQAGTYVHGSSVPEQTILFDYGKTKYISEFSFVGLDTHSANSGNFFEGSNDNSSWTTLISFGNASFSGEKFTYTSTSTTGYRYYRYRATFSSNNYGKIGSVRLIERDEAALYRPTISPATIPNLNNLTAFPPGHIIQTRVGTSHGYVQSGGGSSHVWGNTSGIPGIEIAPIFATSKILVKLSMNVHSAAHVIYIDFYRSIAGGSGTLASTTHNLSGQTAGLAYHNADHTAQMGISYLDSPATTNNITYRGSFRSSGANQVVYLGDANGFSSIIAMEIAQ